MVIFDGSFLTIEDIISIAEKKQTIKISSDKAFRSRISRGKKLLDSLLLKGEKIYGLNTGFGDSCDESIPPYLLNDLAKNLYIFHGCGMGRRLDVQRGRSVLAVSLTSLCRGFSGISENVLLKIECLFHQDIIPCIPEEGSVGASGDLTPMSYVVAVLCGERHVFYQGQVQETAKVFRKLSINPLALVTREALAIMNSTATMTGLACIAFQRASYLSRLTASITAMTLLVTMGNVNHFDDFLFRIKPHPGQRKVAKWLRDDLKSGAPRKNVNRLQDRYSIRCAPHVIGVLEDALPWLRQLIEAELNSTCDNPAINTETGELFNGGNFYGGHIALAMDTLKNVIANISDLLDRQIALMVDIKFNHGLPANLKGVQGERAVINHGFKAVQIGSSAWTAEALKQTMPASVFSRSTECHNQDKVSMGAIAARDCLRILELTEQVVSATLLVCCQGLELRVRQKELAFEDMTPNLITIFKSVRTISPFLEEDRALEHELRGVLALIQTRHWNLTFYSSTE